MEPLAGVKVLILAGDAYEDLELHYPRLRLIEAGADVIVAGAEAGAVYRGKHGYPCRADAALDDVSAEEYAALVIPGGQMPDRLRMDDTVLQLVQAFVNDGRIVAAICHGPQILISAGVVGERRMTCYRSVRDDLINAGARFADEPVVIDRPFVTSRTPADLPPFCRAIIAEISQRPAAAPAARRAAHR